MEKVEGKTKGRKKFFSAQVLCQSVEEETEAGGHVFHSREEQIDALDETSFSIKLQFYINMGAWLPNLNPSSPRGFGTLSRPRKNTSRIFRTGNETKRGCHTLGSQQQAKKINDNTKEQSKGAPRRGRKRRWGEREWRTSDPLRLNSFLRYCRGVGEVEGEGSWHFRRFFEVERKKSDVLN